MTKISLLIFTLLFFNACFTNPKNEDESGTNLDFSDTSADLPDSIGGRDVFSNYKLRCGHDQLANQNQNSDNTYKLKCFILAEDENLNETVIDANNLPPNTDILWQDPISISGSSIQSYSIEQGPNNVNRTYNITMEDSNPGVIRFDLIVANDEGYVRLEEKIEVPFSISTFGNISEATTVFHSTSSGSNNDNNNGGSNNDNNGSGSDNNSNNTNENLGFQQTTIEVDKFNLHTPDSLCTHGNQLYFSNGNNIFVSDGVNVKIFFGSPSVKSRYFNLSHPLKFRQDVESYTIACRGYGLLVHADTKRGDIVFFITYAQQPNPEDQIRLVGFDNGGHNRFSPDETNKPYQKHFNKINASGISYSTQDLLFVASDTGGPNTKLCAYRTIANHPADTYQTIKLFCDTHAAVGNKLINTENITESSDGWIYWKTDTRVWRFKNNTVQHIAGNGVIDNPFQNSPAIQSPLLEGYLSFDEMGRLMIGQNKIGVPMFTLINGNLIPRTAEPMLIYNYIYPTNQGLWLIQKGNYAKNEESSAYPIIAYKPKNGGPLQTKLHGNVANFLGTYTQDKINFAILSGISFFNNDILAFGVNYGLFSKMYSIRENSTTVNDETDLSGSLLQQYNLNALYNAIPNKPLTHVYGLKQLANGRVFFAAKNFIFEINKTNKKVEIYRELSLETDQYRIEFSVDNRGYLYYIHNNKTYRVSNNSNFKVQIFTNPNFASPKLIRTDDQDNIYFYEQNTNRIHITNKDFVYQTNISLPTLPPEYSDFPRSELLDMSFDKSGTIYAVIREYDISLQANVTRVMKHEPNEQTYTSEIFFGNYTTDRCGIGVIESTSDSSNISEFIKLSLNKICPSRMWHVLVRDKCAENGTYDVFITQTFSTVSTIIKASKTCE